MSYEQPSVTVPSLVVRGGGATAKFTPQGLRWQQGRKVTRIPYSAIGAVSRENSRGRRPLVRVVVRSPGPGAPAAYELRCSVRQSEVFSRSLRELVERHQPPQGARPPSVTRLAEEEEELARHAPRTPLQWVRRGMAVLFVIDSLILLTQGRTVAAIATWAGLPFWLLVPLAGIGASGCFEILRDQFVGGVKVEAALVARRTRETKNGLWPLYVYEFTDLDGFRRQCEVSPSFRFARAHTVRTLWYRPGHSDEKPVSHGDMVGFAVLGVLAAALTLGLAAVGLLAVPGVLLAG
ncbi:hypothetical protein [Streptomyces sp. NBC_01497]|uniref:hypothetical protein n=1 Tax=Streptomyces sp. NBC_01497 TaxID=2903885 RepID=UPI002E3416DC|nr:hypothetical protein [Streptomyces sp. NBC_01497]